MQLQLQLIIADSIPIAIDIIADAIAIAIDNRRFNCNCNWNNHWFDWYLDNPDISEYRKVWQKWSNRDKNDQIGTNRDKFDQIGTHTHLIFEASLHKKPLRGNKIPYRGFKKGGLFTSRWYSQDIEGKETRGIDIEQEVYEAEKRTKVLRSKPRLSLRAWEIETHFSAGPGPQLLIRAKRGNFWFFIFPCADC